MNNGEKNLNKDLNKAFLVCIAFFVFFSLLPIEWHTIADFDFHFQKAKGCNGQFDCEIYFPLLHFFGSIFSFSEIAFSRYLLFLIAFATPMLLYFVTRNWVSTWFYFATTQYFYLIEGGAAYPQALAGIMLLALFFFKNNWIRLAILVLSLLAHSQAFGLIGISWVVLLFFENFKTRVLPACSAFFGKTEADPVGNKVQVELVSVTGQFHEYGVQLKDIANFFIRIFPVPFLLASFWQLWREKNFAPIVLSFIFFYVSMVSSPRVLAMIPLLLLPSLTRFYSCLNGWWKKGFIVLSVLSFFWMFGSWVLFKINCL